MGLLLLEEYKYAITSVSLLCALCVILFGFKKINQLPLIGKYRKEECVLPNKFLPLWAPIGKTLNKLFSGI